MQMFVEPYRDYCTVVRTRKEKSDVLIGGRGVEEDGWRRPSLEMHQSCISGCISWRIRASSLRSAILFDS